jgi:hypothetical protein
MFNIILSSIEAIYIIYMLNYYKSKTNYADPDITFSNAFLAHPVTHSDVPISMVCPAGNFLSYIFAAYLIGREFILNNVDKSNFEINIVLLYKLFNLCILVISMNISIINTNVFLYLMPIFIIEFVRLFFSF